LEGSSNAQGIISIMIPIQLRLSGFLSYRDPIDLDFTTFDLACISGYNGAGKSSLLDAITWALFGQARKRDDSVVNLQSKAAEVTFIFEYEKNIYRILRTWPRGKTSTLEFQILQDQENSEGGRRLIDLVPPSASWRPLSERTLRETQLRIEQMLRLDYETFVNAAFFLQGKADQFTQQNATKRKDVLGNILGLEMWETYKQRTADKRRVLEDEVSSIDVRITEIELELIEEDPRKARLQQLELELKRLTSARRLQESVLENIKKTAASLNQQSKLVETLAVSLERSRFHFSGLQSRLAEREIARAADSELRGRAREVEANYKTWQKARGQLEEWDKIASEFHEHEKDRAPLLGQIASERARLEEELRSLILEGQEIEDQAVSIKNLRSEIENTGKLLAEAEKRIAKRASLEEDRIRAREHLAKLKAENESLKAEMEELKLRIDKLDTAEGAACPLCGQSLTDQHRKSTLKQLRVEGKEKGDTFRSNKGSMDDVATDINDFESEIGKLSTGENERLAYSNLVAQLTERMESMQSQSNSWESTGKQRLKAVEKILESEKYAADAQKLLAKLDKQLAKMGYDASAHDAVRKAEFEKRQAEEEFNQLEKARATLRPIEDEITNLTKQIRDQGSAISQQQTEYETAERALALAQAESPDVDQVERELFNLQEEENRLNQEVGAARQKVSVLEELRKRRVDYTQLRGGLALKISHHKALERAFGKDGIPALLIEQALPQIESKTNDLLDRLSDGQMSVRFVTQAGYKDKKRADLKETLDILISDAAGVRDYEMYSGGEAFRVNFAIRLALSEVLAQRKGARLQTLVIDEGFGSQDAQGRQRLIEAINMVKSDFAKILVITHLDELKDAFPTRIEVEKTDRGSTVHVY
jgi:DNA repair protein SbcC/Rad50